MHRDVQALQHGQPGRKAVADQASCTQLKCCRVSHAVACRGTLHLAAYVLQQELFLGADGVSLLMGMGLPPGRLSPPLPPSTGSAGFLLTMW